MTQTPGSREPRVPTILPSPRLREASATAGLFFGIAGAACAVEAWRGFSAADHYGVLSNWGLPAILWAAGVAISALGPVLQLLALPWRGYPAAMVVVGFVLCVFGFLLSALLGLWLLDVWFWAP